MIARLENRLAWEKLETKTHEKTIRCRDEEVPALREVAGTARRFACLPQGRS